MAYREDEVTNDRGPNSRQIRHDIESTRREMDRNLDALESKLTPAQLAMEAWGLFRGGSTAGASRLWKSDVSLAQKTSFTHRRAIT